MGGKIQPSALVFSVRAGVGHDAEVDAPYPTAASSDAMLGIFLPLHFCNDVGLSVPSGMSRWYMLEWVSGFLPGDARQWATTRSVVTRVGSRLPQPTSVFRLISSWPHHQLGASPEGHDLHLTIRGIIQASRAPLRPPPRRRPPRLHPQWLAGGTRALHTAPPHSAAVHASPAPPLDPVSEVVRRAFVMGSGPPRAPIPQRAPPGTAPSDRGPLSATQGTPPPASIPTCSRTTILSHCAAVESL